MKPFPKPDGRSKRGDESRQRVLTTAVQLASTNGLDGLTFGVLALTIDSPKSSISALFGSKEKLQLATIEHAQQLFEQTVLHKVDQTASPLKQLQQLGDAWFDYLTDDVFEGGCFFFATAGEMDNQPGSVRDAVVSANKHWAVHITDLVMASLEDTQPNLTSTDQALLAQQTAFQLNAAGMASNFNRQLFDDPNAIAHGRALWDRELQRLTKT